MGVLVPECNAGVSPLRVHHICAEDIISSPSWNSRGDRHRECRKLIRGNGDAPARWYSTRIAHTGWNYSPSPSHNAAPVEYACLCRHTCERHYATGGARGLETGGSHQGIIRLIVAEHRVLDGLRSAKCDELVARVFHVFFFPCRFNLPQSIPPISVLLHLGEIFNSMI